MLILIATENQLIAKTIVKQLLQLEQACICTYSYEEAISTYKNHRPDLVIADISLKSDEGKSLTHIIRLDFQSTTPIMTIGKIGFQKEFEKEIELGSQVSLTYPFQTLQFKEAYKKLSA